MTGEKEKIIDNSGAKVFYSKTPSKIKEIILMKDAYHELHKEANKD